MRNVFLLLICALFASGCATRAYNTKHDYSVRDTALKQLHEHLQEKYANTPCWYTSLTKKEKKELKRVRNIDPDLYVQESIKLKGMGSKSAVFTNGAKIERQETIELKIPEIKWES